MTNKQNFTPEDWTKILESVALSRVAVMRKLKMAGAFAATFLIPASAFAAHVQHHYHGGVWYGTGRRYWHGQWYDYGVGACWLATPIGYVWTCE